MSWTPARIVCAADFSPGGAVALAQALVLAERRKAHLDVLYCSSARRVRPEDAADLRSRLEALVAEANVASVPASAFVLHGRPVSAIAEHVAARPADLIVIGPTPRGIIDRSGMRFAAAVARRAGCPVITLPKGSSVDDVRSQFRRIVCAVDESRAAAGALQLALSFAQQSGGHLTVLHVVEGFPEETVYSAASVSRLLQEFDTRGRAIMHRLRALVPPAALHWCDVDYRVVPGIARNTIVSVAAAEGADLVVVGRPPPHWLGVLGSTAAGVFARAACPVLTVPGPAGRLPASSRPDAVTAVEMFRAWPERKRVREPRSEPGSVVSLAEARASRLLRHRVGAVVDATRRRGATSATGQAR